MSIFQQIDTIRRIVDDHKVEPLFSNEVQALNERHAKTVLLEKNNLLRVMAKLIAYSNNAPSNKVTELIEKGNFEEAFHKFNIDAVANDSPERIIGEEWDNLRAIRFKKKIHAIVKCANILKDNNSHTIDSLITRYKIPPELTCDTDIDRFWHQFDLIIADYQMQSMPHFKNMTTLLHLLLHLGFPCIKPDLIIMKVAASIGIVEERNNHNTYRPEERKKVVRTIQHYCLERKMKPAALDLYFLIFGGQKDSVKYAKGLPGLTT